MAGNGRRIVSTREHFTQEEREVDGVTRCVAVCIRCHAILPYSSQGGTGHLVRHHAQHIQMNEEDAERLFEVEARRRRASRIWEHYTRHDYEENGVNRCRAVCNRCQQQFNLVPACGNGHFVRHHMMHVKRDEQAPM
jgi:hypothetical protein